MLASCEAHESVPNASFLQSYQQKTFTTTRTKTTNSMLFITARLQVPDIGLDAQIDWQPHYFKYLFRHVYFAMAFDIIVFPQIPLVHIDRTFNFAFAGY
jgi:hypothetical protein